MGFLNRLKREKPRPKIHLNWMGGPSFTPGDPFLRLRLAASSCFFGEPMYYHRDSEDDRPVRHKPGRGLTDAEVGLLRATLHAVDPQEWRSLTPAALMERTIDEALAADPERTLAEAVRLRQEEHIRTTPQVMLVRAANHPAVRGTGLVRRYAPQIISRADEPAVGLAYQIARYGGTAPIPNALKRAWRDAMERFDDYALAKYRLEGRGVKLVDVANLVHPKSEAVNRLMRDELRLTDQTWEAIISAQGSTAEAWTEALKVMGHMALLRNLRNLVKAGLDPAPIATKLVEGAPRGKQLPFRYYSAYTALGSEAPDTLRQAVEEAMTIALGNLPTFDGRVMALCDNSGSARGATTSSMGTVRVSTIANLTAVLTGMRAQQGYVGVFGDRLETQRLRPDRSIFRQLDAVEKLGETVGGATENGIWLFWDQAIRERQHWDMVFVYSDMQAGHGGLYGPEPDRYRDFIWGGPSGRYIDVAKLVAAYRAQVNPKVLVFLVQVAGYSDTILPEFYDRTYMLGGWSENILRFAAEMIGLNT